jgi:hypothetical protein
VRVAVGLADVAKVYVGELLVAVSLYTFVSCFPFESREKR